MVPYFDPVPIEVPMALAWCAASVDWRGHVDHAVAVSPAFERSED